MKKKNTRKILNKKQENMKKTNMRKILYQKQNMKKQVWKIVLTKKRKLQKDT